jgi:hypothetical protein
VYTASTSFGLLPPDLSQYSNWLSEYGNPSTTIYQDESNVISGMLYISNTVNTYVAGHGYSFLGFVNANELELDSGTYKIDYYGTFSSVFSQVTKIFLYDSSSGVSATETGTFNYPGYPVLTAAEPGSVITGATDLVPNPATPSSDLTGVVLLDASYNGSYWVGNIKGYSEAISDLTNNKMVQINIFEEPAAISFATNTVATTGFQSLSTPTVDGAGLQVSDYSTGTVTDSLLITGFSYAANSVLASKVLATAIPGTDSVTLDGSGSLNALTMLNSSSVTSVAVQGQAVSIANNLANLEALALSRKLSSVSITDGGVISVTSAQLSSDYLALLDVTTPNSLMLSGQISAAYAIGANPAVLQKVASGVIVTDSSTNVAQNFDKLNSVPKLTGVQLTDTIPLSITFAQLYADSTVMAALPSNYALALTEVPTYAEAFMMKTDPHVISVACFVAGTRIATKRGEIAVEALHAGDTAISCTGEQHIKWIGHRHVDCARHPRPLDVQPVRVCADAFANGQPHHDLLLSPDHAVFINGVLVPVRYLINGRTIIQQRVDEVTYWHVELERHDVILAEGLSCESYLDTGNRSAFVNGGDEVMLHPDFARKAWETKACAELVLDGPKLAAAKRMLLAQAEVLGYRLTNDPSLSIVVDGRMLASTVAGKTWCVSLPPDVQTVRLVSHAWVPTHTRANEHDTRFLGVAVANLHLDGTPVGMDDPRLSSGWLEPETDWRWTDGDAGLALAGVRELAFDVVMIVTYWEASAGVDDPLACEAGSGRMGTQTMRAPE